ncbi:MAG: lytic transglycosylase domain-containing protein, partial [Janthinobacterium lividum]
SQRILSEQGTGWTEDAAAAFAGQELVRAATLLVAWGEPRRARPFLLRLDDLADGPGMRALAARFAGDLGLPDQAVAIARRAGRDGVVLGVAGWPRPVSPPEGVVEPAVALGLIRQESSFDAGAGSPVGARGLMQLMPATAAAVARRLNEPASVPALTADPAYNMRLGTAYLRGLMDQFDGALPLALAGYNAGPHRVQAWLTAQGDPLAGGVDMLDWIEMIPFNETRNYVQRVIENIVIYRAQRGDTAVHPLSRWLGWAAATEAAR